MQSLITRFKALADKSAWLLIAPALIALFLIDASAAKTLVEWSLFGLVLAGVAIVISRVVFPQINLTELVRDAQDFKSTASGIIVAAVICFVGMVMLALVLWAKA